ncbi:MAG: aldose 1-epimerase family protein [Candidatus Poribacteria bacterium]|nr:aldose 1-epimerase family protein [Candidatus Poribacteria bacterium]
MIQLYGRQYHRLELLRHVGDISQIAGAKQYQLTSGNEKGTDAVDFRTGAGLNFTVLPDRGLDISYAEYNGIPLCWRSSTGDVAPSYYEPEGIGWLRGFSGGLLTTCGMTYLGSPDEDEGEALGLHGRVSYIPAKNVWVDSRWEGDRYTMWVQGKVTETTVSGENLCRTRRIWAELGTTKLHIEDIVENLGYQDTPHMYLFHINPGFPIVDEGSELLAPSTQVTPFDDPSAEGLSRHAVCEPPTGDFREQVFYHEMEGDEHNHVYVALVNRSFNDGQGIGLYIRYHRTQLPKFVQWKMNGEGLYVIGLEPANCWVDGRAKERERGTLEFIEPGGRRHYEVEIGMLTSNAEIERLAAEIAAIKISSESGNS